MREVLDVPECAVEDEGFTAGVGLDELVTGCLGNLLNVLHGFVLSFVHCVVLGELEHNRLLVAVKVRLNIVSRVDLAEGALPELLGDNEAVLEEESLQLLYDWDLTMLLAAFHEDFLDSIFGFHLLIAVCVVWGVSLQLS